MKVQVYDPKARGETLALRLEKVTNGAMVVAVDQETGVKLSAGNLIKISNDGTYFVQGGVSGVPGVSGGSLKKEGDSS